MPFARGTGKMYCQFYDEGELIKYYLFEMVAQHFSLYSLNAGVVIEKKNELRLNV